jgi:hypothetical protein
MRGMILLVAALAPACDGGGKGEDKQQAAADQTAAAPTEAPRAQSNIERIPIAVPYGKQVDCSAVIDPALFSKYIGDAIGQVKDRAKSNSESSLSCALMRAGEPPKSDAQLRKFEREGMKLGVLPGDEYCLVTAYCSLATDVDRLKKKCEDEKNLGNDAVGEFACVHTTQRGTKEAYTYHVIDPDTKCMLEVMGGPSVTDEPLVQNCTRAALEDITLAELRSFH